MAMFITSTLPVKTITHVGEKSKTSWWRRFFGKRKDDKKRLMDKDEEDSCLCSFREWSITEGMREAGFDV